MFMFHVYIITFNICCYVQVGSDLFRVAQRHLLVHLQQRNFGY